MCLSNREQCKQGNQAGKKRSQYSTYHDFTNPLSSHCKICSCLVGSFQPWSGFNITNKRNSLHCWPDQIDIGTKVLCNEETRAPLVCHFFIERDMVHVSRHLLVFWSSFRWLAGSLEGWKGRLSPGRGRIKRGINLPTFAWKKENNKLHPLLFPLRVLQ